MAESFDVVFHGNSKSECADFIRAVRKYAKQNKKTRENQWIADEVYDAFAGEALWWYVRLPADVRGDWERLQEALVTRWVADNEVDDLSAGVSSLATIPTPAAAVSAVSQPVSSSSSTSSQSGNVGRVRIRVVGRPEVQYLSKDPRKQGNSAWLGAFGATTDATLAMTVRLAPAGPNAHRLELVEHESGSSVLAALELRNDGWNSIHCSGLLIGVDAPGQGSLRGHRTTYNGSDGYKDGQFWTDRWQLETTGRLRLRGPEETSDAALFILGIKGSLKDNLWFWGPKMLLHSSVTEVALEFEPLGS